MKSVLSKATLLVARLLGVDVTPDGEVEMPEVGWHSDPALRYRLRFFDCENWTPMVKNWLFRFSDPKWPFYDSGLDTTLQT